MMKIFRDLRRQFDNSSLAPGAKLSLTGLQLSSEGQSGQKSWEQTWQINFTVRSCGWPTCYPGRQSLARGHYNITVGHYLGYYSITEPNCRAVEQSNSIIVTGRGRAAASGVSNRGGRAHRRWTSVAGYRGRKKWKLGVWPRCAAF